jgi:protein SCO1
MFLASVLALAGNGVFEVALAGDAPDSSASCHPAPASATAWKKSTALYRLPDVGLVRDDGVQVSLRNEIDDGKPVILNFIFTTCTTICPVMSQSFTQIQRRLGDDLRKVRMVSISIDPEQDTPARLAEYARKLDAGPQWTFYTGTMEAIISTQKAFGAYRGDKMNHVPVTFLRASPGKPWVRLVGFPKAEEVVEEYRQLLAAR